MKKVAAAKIEKQLEFAPGAFKKALYYGGEFRNRRKGRGFRPISAKKPIHLVLKSSRARGRFSFRYGRNETRIKKLIQEHCRKYGATLHQYSNNFNHLHLLVRFRSRPSYLRFIRSLTAAITLSITGVNKLSSLKKILGKRFWDFRPYTRIVKGWKGFRIARDYVLLNQLEVFGLRPLHATAKNTG